MSGWKLVSISRPPCRLCLKMNPSRPVISRILCKSFTVNRHTFYRLASSSSSSTTLADGRTNLNLEQDEDENIKAKIVFSTHLFKVDPRHTWVGQKIQDMRTKQDDLWKIADEGYPVIQSVSLKYLQDVLNEGTTQKNRDCSEMLSTEPVQTDVAHLVEENVHFPLDDDSKPSKPEKFYSRRVRIQNLETLNSDRIHRKKIQEAMDKKWMSDYESFKEGKVESWQKMYGTCQKDIPVSSVPCGGCGAHFQCQEPSIPGYLPSEILIDLSEEDLKGIVCQRCHFLKNYEIALDVKVPPAEYPSVLDVVAQKNGLIVLIIDLLDMPCSIWPGITKIIGTKKPVIIVGNKVDLLPGDHRGYFGHVKNVLKRNIAKYGLDSVKLRNIFLISARTGFGVEELITELHRRSEYKGDVYLLGCTNVGKSTLFNCLLQSDLCKVQAVDLVQRATTSPWPNTTLNLLKFPMMRLEGWKLRSRLERLVEEKSPKKMEARLRALQFRANHLYHMPSLLQFVGRTFVPEKSQEKSADVFSAIVRKDKDGRKLGLDENHDAFKSGRWCYDTPGVSHPAQILSFLTTEELLEVLPSSSLVPRTFRFQLGQSLFLAGLGRVDFIDGQENFVYATVFASSKLPVTITWTHDADEVYSYALGTEILGVPHRGQARLARWSGLSPSAESFEVHSVDRDRSAADIVLSSAGWVAITTDPMKKAVVRGWTPEGRGIFCRKPALLPYAVKFRGLRLKRTPMYGISKALPQTESEIDDVA